MHFVLLMLLLRSNRISHKRHAEGEYGIGGWERPELAVRPEIAP